METSDPQKQFQAAVKVIQSLPPKGSYHPSYETMLRFYGFYKQATLGPCNIMKPGIWDLVGRYKWNAWNKLGGMSKEDAMKAYVEDMKRVAQEVIDMLPKIENADEMFQYFESLYDVIPDMPRPPASYFKDKAVRLKRTVLSNPNIKVNGSVDKGMNEELSVQQKTNGAKEGLVEESVVTSHCESELYRDSMDQVDQEKASSVLTAITFKTYHTSSVVQHTKMPQENSRKAAEEAKAAGPVKDTIPFEGEAGMSGRQSTETGAKGLDNELYQGRDKKAKSSSVGAGHKEAHAGKCMCNLQEEIVAAVYSLQADMQNVMLRLTRLEEIVMSQMSLQNSSKRWLPGGQVRIYLFLVFWPFVIHWLHSACRKGVKN